MDPTLTRADRLVGQVLGEVGALPDVFTEVEINFFLLRRLLGVRTQVSFMTSLLVNLTRQLQSLPGFLCLVILLRWNYTEAEVKRLYGTGFRPGSMKSLFGSQYGRTQASPYAGL